MSARPPFPAVGDGTGFTGASEVYREELALAFRNRGMLLEGLRYGVTPVGLHYLLVHYDIPAVDPRAWQLEIGGCVARPLRLSLEQLMQRPARTLAVTMECAGNGRALMTPRRISQPWLHEAIGNAEWTGTPLAPLLAEAGLSPKTVDIVFTGLDRGVEGGVEQDYARSLSPADAAAPDVLLAWAMNGRPLEPQHGFPLRLLVPGWYGMTSVKWLGRIEAMERRFDGYQMTHAYKYAKDDGWDGEPVDRIRVRSLMVPPGVPDFLTRTRCVAAGRVTLEGRAWAGERGIAKVEVSVDGGAGWTEARLGPSVDRYAWRAWHHEWDARPGTHTLCVRATDTSGAAQPMKPDWNFGGYGNNAVQRLGVWVE